MTRSHSSVRAEYVPAARAYDARWARYTRDSLALLRPRIAVAPRRLLDVGCGTGALPRAMQGWGVAPERYVGIDLTAEMLPRADGFVQAAAEALPLPAAAFDLVVSASSIHDWHDPARGLAEMRRVLAPGGRLLLVDWCGDYRSVRLMGLWLRLTGRGVGRIYGSAHLAAVLEGSGFRVVSIERTRISPVWGMMVAEAVAG